MTEVIMSVRIAALCNISIFCHIALRAWL